MTDNPAEAIRDGLVSARQLDSNREPANVVDALFAIARTINRHAEAVESVRLALDGLAENVLALDQIADALSRGKGRVRP